MPEILDTIDAAGQSLLDLETLLRTVRFLGSSSDGSVTVGPHEFDELMTLARRVGANIAWAGEAAEASKIHTKNQRK